MVVKSGRKIIGFDLVEVGDSKMVGMQMLELEFYTIFVELY